ncbi:hypothetical protein PG997_011197 [Apiospora hydei]|uniref:Lipase n=1 Tax=Apiospora hydei TaxID=1337664 RepID=A0ABR1VID9_9PEZI
MRCSAVVLALVAAASVHAGPAIKIQQQQQHGNKLLVHHAAAKRDPGLLEAATGHLDLDDITELLSRDAALKRLDGATDPVLKLVARLRAALHIPAGFTYGAKPPVLLVPGTGSYGGGVFAPNLRKLLRSGSSSSNNVSYADPVWLNVPHAMLGGAQQNAECIAYAINYVSAITTTAAGRPKKDISLITWSQGGLGSQWVLTFWPSTRAKVANLLAVAADFRGTTVADLLCASSVAGVPGLFYPAPARRRQRLGAHDVAVLGPRGLDGAAAAGRRGVGVANVELQQVCGLGNRGRGLLRTRRRALAPLTHALVVDALTHDDGRPGDVSRVDLGEVCSHFAAPGLELADVVATEALMVTGTALFLLGYPEKVTEEPAPFPYAAAASAAPVPASSS